MPSRNQSPQQMFIKLAQENAPIHSFNGETKEYFKEWKESALPEVKATLGKFPEKVPANPELIVEWEEDGLIKQRWLIDVGKYISASFQINIPKTIGVGEKLPAILCWHGHGQFGKDAVMGNVSCPEMSANIALNNYDYGKQMAKEGFVTYAIDWIGKGERDDSGKPYFLSQGAGRDWCNLYYLSATMLGMTSLSINVTHGMAATDFVCTLPQVDPERLGVMGLSGGGTMTLWSALCDERMKAAEIICYSNLWTHFGIRDLNYCGMQVAPGLFMLVDLPDLQGLLAPRPLLVDIGLYDGCFQIDPSMECYKKVEKIYSAAGASDKLELDLFPGTHAWGANKSKEFFSRYL